MARKTKIRLKVEATISLEADCLKYLDHEDLERLEHCVFEIKEISIPFTFDRLKGTIKCTAPNPIELKKARLAYLEANS